MEEQRAFTGRTRRKQTRWTVRLGDVLSRRLITIGGIGTIVAVLLVFVQLATVVAPLFSSASVQGGTVVPGPWQQQQPLRLEIDEYQTTGWALYPDGTLDVFRLDNGEQIARRQLEIGSTTITAAAFPPGQAEMALGLADGTIRLGRIGFQTQFREAEDVPEAVRQLPPGQLATLDDALLQRTPQGQFRVQRLQIELQEPMPLADSAVRLLDLIAPEEGEGLVGGKQYTLACFTAAGQLFQGTVSFEENQFTGQRSVNSNLRELPFQARRQPPAYLLLGGRGGFLLLAWSDGTTRRYLTSHPQQAAMVEQVDVVPAEGARLTAMQFLLGRETVVCGDSQGGLRAWFRTAARQRERTGDGLQLTMAHPLGQADAGVTALGISKRSRMVAAGYADGTLRVFHVTTEQTMIERQIARDPILGVLIAPKDDGLMIRGDRRIWRARFDPAYPEATVASLFLPVWYEGYNEPIHMWQSSFAGVASEMKLGLIPLVFGTLKATLYTMLIAAPLALLAAIYTSEFLSTRWRSRIKPSVEMMASLPSVVLGFLAALVIAPIIADILPATLAAFVSVPLVYLTAAFVWQLLPEGLIRWLENVRMLVLLSLLPIGILLAIPLGRIAERLLFAGDIMRWLDGQAGTGTGAWFLLLLPTAGLVLAIGNGYLVNPWLRRRAEQLGRWQFALLNLAKFLFAVSLAFGGALLFSWLFTQLGWDPRGTYVDTYMQRNSLIVGFAMGFAVIPIIYTLADDALNTVPQHLRSASLGCGATPWQTTVRVVIPTAMSGLFSALMIGLGRAVGETMIVLMAGGNTPIIDWNIFSGFRTLSANIAVELPEAVKESTHYRTLFLAALTLFVLTFCVNTVAEIVRLRFRKRAYQL